MELKCDELLCEIDWEDCVLWVFDGSVIVLEFVDEGEGVVVEIELLMCEYVVLCIMMLMLEESVIWFCEKN